MENYPNQANNISEDPTYRVINVPFSSNQINNLPNTQVDGVIYVSNSATNSNNIYPKPVALNVSNNPIPPSKDENANIPFAGCDNIEKAIRLGFVRKVYSLLTIQLLLTFGAVCLTFIKEVRTFLQDHFYIFYIAAGVALIVILLMCCLKKGMTKVPWNYLLLFLWTISVAYMVMTTCAYYDKEIVITAMGLTVAVSLGLTIYACFTKKDFTYLGGCLSLFVMVFIFYGLFGLWFHKWVYFIYCGIGVILFGLYIIYDTQKILGNFREKYEIDDYVVATLDLYMDVVNLFLILLSLIGVASN